MVFKTIPDDNYRLTAFLFFPDMYSPVMPNTGLLQVVQLDDVADTVLFFLAPGAPARLALDLAGPEQLPFTEVVRKYRRWLGWGEPRIVCLPAWVAGALHRLGDVAGRLGWRPPLRSTARREITVELSAICASGRA